MKNAFRFVLYGTVQFWAAVLNGVATGFYAVSGLLQVIATRTAVTLDESHPILQTKPAEKPTLIETIDAGFN